MNSMKITATFTQKEMEDVLKAHLAREGYDTISIKFKTNTKWVGDQRDGYNQSSFEGAEVEVRKAKTHYMDR
jgi:hypothetical protein